MPVKTLVRRVAGASGICSLLTLTSCDLLSPDPVPAALAFSVHPAGAAGGTPFTVQPVVQVLDSDGRPIRNVPQAVAMRLGANPTGGRLAGTTTVTTVEGVATFADLAIDKAASGYTLIATLDSISATSSAFGVEVGPPVALRFANQPQSGWDNGAPLGSPLGVEVTDAGGNRIADGADTITVTIGSNPSGGALVGNTTRVAAAGIATFTDLTVNRSGIGYTLVASAPGRSSVTSKPFDVRRWTGQLVLAVTTTGLNLDPDGYAVRVGGGPSRAVPVNGTLVVDSLQPGGYRLTFGGVAFNCALADTAADVLVQSGITSHYMMTATCRRYLSNEVLIQSEQFGASEIVVMNPSGSGRVRLTSGGGIMPAASPDGLTIAFASARTGTGIGIYLMGADGAGVRLLVHRSTGDAEPAWSPDGTRLAFRSLTAGPYGAYGRIWVVNADGTGLRQVSPDTASTAWAYDDVPTWLPDGHSILFNRSGRLCIVDADNGDVTPVGIPDSLLPVNEPRLSPDGSKIAFMSPGNVDNYDLYLVNVDGSNAVRLTADTAQDDSPVWSPDGTQLLFARVVNDKPQVYTMNVAVGGGTSLGPVVAWAESPEDWATVK